MGGLKGGWWWACGEKAWGSLGVGGKLLRYGDGCLVQGCSMQVKFLVFRLVGTYKHERVWFCSLK